MASGPPKSLALHHRWGYKGHPALSPDGDKVAYEWCGDIYVKPVATGAQALQLTEDEAYEIPPTWSPDGRRVAFVRWVETGRTLYTVPALGGRERKLLQLRPLSGGSLISSVLAWSPDGDWLAFAERPSEDEPPRIARLSLATLEVEPLTSPPGLSAGDVAPACSPEGTRIAFVRAGANGFVDFDVWIQPVDGGEARRLTSRNWGFCEGVTWTPDGRQVLVTAGRGPGHAVRWRSR